MLCQITDVSFKNFCSSGGFWNPDWVTCKDFKIVNYAMKKNKKKNIFSKYLRWLWGFRLKWPLRSPILRFFKKRNDEWDWKLEWKFWKSKNFKDFRGWNIQIVLKRIAEKYNFLNIVKFLRHWWSLIGFVRFRSRKVTIIQKVTFFKTKSVQNNLPKQKFKWDILWRFSNTVSSDDVRFYLLGFGSDI